MRFTTIASLLAASLSATTTASPILQQTQQQQHEARAGAPAYVPITPPCSVSYPLPQTSTTAANQTSTDGYRPSAALTAAHQIYAWDRPASDAAYINATTLWTNCIEQCNGLSGCKSAFLAYDVPAESHYGAPGGALGIGCRMYDVAVAAADFEIITNGSYVRPVAGVIGGEGCAK
ncbi:hypothetical protein BFW01_g3074 [Lasiodiplodia theobromae]|nr:hypothetical protein BFW01_g3074 [Lasiodiplodia theobromae]